MITQPHAPSRDDATALVERAAGDVITADAKDRLVIALLTHNDGRVARHLTKAASARQAAWKATGDNAGSLWEVWSSHLHRALDESWPIGHPAYRRHDDDPVIPIDEQVDLDCFGEPRDPDVDGPCPGCYDGPGPK